jgi:PAS domain S-box-containing protein
MTTASHPDARILIVDDQDFNVRLLERVLKQGGYTNYRSLLDPREVVAQVPQYQPDLILLDLMMPHMDGIEVMEGLQPLLPPGAYLPILILTADINPESKRRALAAGARDFLSKPLDNLEVLLRINNLLETRFLYLQLQRQNQDLERTVRERTHKLQEQAGLMDLASDAMIVCDLDDRVRFWNQGAERVYGWTAAEALGRPAGELLAGGPSDGRAPRSLPPEQKEWHGELRQRHRDGRELIVRSRVTLVADEEGRPRALFAINTDVTAERLLEKQLQRAQRMESIGALAGGVAHDLNNMMTPILMGVGMLRRTVTDPLGQGMLEAMRLSAQCGTELVKQILTFVRGAGEQRRPLHLAPFLGEVRSLVQQTFPPAILVRLQAAADLRPVNADVTQLYQVMMNLCINARDAMPEGGELRVSAANRVVTEAEARALPDALPGRFVVLAVEDTGTGIAPDHLKRIFDPLFTTKEPGRGTGLGLATVANIVRKHEGFIAVASVPEQGTRFEVYLPAVEGAVGPAEPPARPAPEGHGELVLVVEDEGAIRAIMRTTLEASGYRVLAAHDGGEAQALFREHHHNVRAALVDLVMPVMDGPTTIRGLRQVNPHTPVIAVSTEAPGGRDVRGEHAVQGVLFKPFTADQLLTTRHAVLAAARADPGRG